MPNPSRRRRWLIAVLVLLPLALAVAGWLAVRPWLAAPDATPEAVAATWKRVETWAGESRHPPAAIHSLNAAIDHHRRAKRADEPWDPSRAPEPVTDAAAQQALTALVEWSRRGGLGDDPCIGDPADLEAPPPRLVDMSRLARLALQSSRTSEDEAFTAALRLGSHLRNRGPLLAGAVGFSIARDALAVVEARHEPPGPAFLAFAPRREEVLPILAREAVCSLRMAEAAFARGTDDPGAAPTDWAARWSAAWVGPERELAMARWYLGERVEAAARAGDDLTAVAATQQLPDDPDALPASLLVRGLAFAGAAVVEDMKATLAAYARVEPTS